MRVFIKQTVGFKTEQLCNQCKKFAKINFFVKFHAQKMRNFDAVPQFVAEILYDHVFCTIMLYNQVPLVK